MGNNQSNNKVAPHPPANNKKFILGIIDVQRDFCKDGALAVSDAESIIAPINKLRFTYYREMHTFITKDYHPTNHMSFCTTHGKNAFDKITYETKIGIETVKTEQTLWPKHCVRDTPGSDFHNDLIITKHDIVIHKGENSEIESYSAFGDAFENKYEKTPLQDILRNKKITDIVLVGLATDYCVYYTALDALRFGYNVHIIMSCTRGVAKDTTDAAVKDLFNKKVSMYDTVEDFYDYYRTERP